MTRHDLKNIAEMVGIIGLVLSLTFIGLQMRQSQRMAMNESELSLLQSHVAIRSAINEHADVWTRSRTGEVLSPEDSVIFRNLVVMQNDAAFYDYMRAVRLGQTDVAQVVVSDFAGLLYQHPGARKEWLSREDHLIRDRRVMNPGGGVASFWKDGVTGSLVVLDRATASRADSAP